MATAAGHRELKKGTAELLVLALVRTQARHGYEISKLIERRSKGELKFHAASLYPLLYRLEGRGWLKAQWQHKAGTRPRRIYKITMKGEAVLKEQLGGWQRFVRSVNAVVSQRDA